MALRRSEYIIGTPQDWAALDPVLTNHQLGIEEPDWRIKIGDGVTTYSQLDFVTTGIEGYDEIDGGTP